MTVGRYVEFSEIENFNSHAHVERDVSFKLVCYAVAHFNSHAHVERDGKAVRKIITLNISTHTLTWSVTRVFAIFVKFFTNFNSHAHVERDAKSGSISIKTTISTHTLTWSVTKDFLRYAIGKIISTHTLTWSVTKLLETG